MNRRKGIGTGEGGGGSESWSERGHHGGRPEKEKIAAPAEALMER